MRFDLSLCGEFAYPDIVREHLQTILDAIVESRIDILSMILVGSTARGELSYDCEDESLRLFSDYEFVILTADVVNAKIRDSLEFKLEALGHQLCPNNPLFHIDLAWHMVSRLSDLPHTIANFEQKETGKVVFGSDYRDSMPAVSIETVDLKDANEIIYKRLWALLLYLPKDFVRQEMDATTRKLAMYVLARNALDLTTILLPHEGILLPTYAQRVEYLSKNYTRLQFGTHFGSNLPHFLEACLECRQTLRWKNSLVDFYVRTIDYLELAIEYLLRNQNAMGCDLYSSLLSNSSLIFNEQVSARRAVKHVIRIVARRHSLRRAVQWAFLNHKGLMTCCFLHMHRALDEHLSGCGGQALTHLNRAWLLLGRLASEDLGKPDHISSFEDEWLDLRQGCGHFWREFVRKGRSLYRYRHECIMEWKSD